MEILSIIILVFLFFNTSDKDRTYDIRNVGFFESLIMKIKGEKAELNDDFDEHDHP